jgi:mono/diheme cytochrome c family protein
LDDEGEPVLDDEDNPVTRRIPLDPEKNAEQREAIAEMLAEIVDGWNAANEEIIVPDPEQIPDDRTPEQIAEAIVKGRELFYGVRANCIQCHGPTGLGDGQQNDQDNWDKAHKAFLEANISNPELEAEQTAVAATLFPVRNAIPRNLRQGVYRGGRRRIDVFWRIYAGIAGTPMPGLGPASAGATGTLTEEEMWNIVDYVLAMPYEPPSRPLKALPQNMYENVVGN